MLKLYEIRKEIMDCIYIPETDEFVNQETGELVDADKLKQLKMDRDEKRENIACLIKNLKAEKEAVCKEKQRLANREKSIVKNILRLTDYLADDLQGEKFKTTRCNVYYTTSKSVEADISEIEKMFDADNYLRKTVELNKDAIKEALNQGLDIPASFVEKHSLVVR